MIHVDFFPIQCDSGNFDTSNFCYHSDILSYFQFQCNSGKFDLAIGGTACATCHLKRVC